VNEHSINGKRFAAVLFDLDGTLLDTAPDFVTSLNLLLAARQRAPLAPAVIRAAVTHGSPGLISLAFGYGPGDPDFEPVRQELLGIYLDNLARETRPFPGADILLARLAEQAIPWGIVTNKPSLYTNAILERLPFAVAPATVVCPDHVKNSKPDPEPVLLACRQIGVVPADALYVGDHLRDIQSGASAGTITAAAAYGYLDAGENPHSWGADHVIDNFSDLDRIIFQ